MADDLLTGKDEDAEEFVMVEVDELPAPGAAPAAAAAPSNDPDDDADGDEPVEDRRLADEDEEDDANPGVKERKKRRERQKAARDAAQARIRTLESTNSDLIRRLEALESGQTGTQKALTAQKIVEAQAEVAKAERIMAAAVEAGNGADVVEATKLRDEARDNVKALEAFEKTIVAPTKPATSPAIQAYRSQWLQSNDWFNPNGGDEQSDIAIAIDRRVEADGFKPDTLEYWQELTKRVANRLFPKTGGQREVDDQGAQDPPARDNRRKGPPVGSSRTHAPTSTRREVYVTPERKQAMQEAGYWDDAKKRTQMLKAYAEHDRANSGRG